MTKTCGVTASLGSVCAKPVGHEGEHCSRYGYTWTDESDRAAADRLSRDIEGRDG